MKDIYTVELEDGETLTVDVDQRDIRKWESQHDLSFFMTPNSYTVITQLVYMAGSRSGAFKDRFPTYEDFDKVAVYVQIANPPKPLANPTQPEATDDSSVP